MEECPTDPVYFVFLVSASSSQVLRPPCLLYIRMISSVGPAFHNARRLFV